MSGATPTGRLCAVFAAALLGGCSLLIGAGDNDVIRCELADAGDPCPSGLQCISGVCTSMCSSSQPEICGNSFDDDCDGNVDEASGDVPENCDGEDNDCDMRIDEGLDEDGDGYTWCPLAPPPEQLDCLDSNPDVHPPDASGQPDEVCDGADNDCDMRIDENPRSGEPLCEVGKGCFPGRGGCVFIDCRLDEVICPPRHACIDATEPAVCELVTFDCTLDGCDAMPGTVCDPGTLQCVTPVGLGEACERDVQCANGICVSAESLGLRVADVGNAQRICTNACCTNADCPSGSSCWASPLGSRGCVRNTVLEQGTYGVPSTVGCQSQQTCSGMDCTLTTDDAYTTASRTTFACGTGPGTSTGGCSRDSECASGMCRETCARVSWLPEIFVACETACRNACRTGSDCGSDRGCVYHVPGSGTGAVQSCRYVGDLVEERGACGNDRDCRDHGCYEGQCRPSCCTDSQCSGSERCRPTALHGRFEMRCIDP